MRMKRKWRVVKDAHLGYEVQWRYLWWPFWTEHNFCNTFTSVEDAKAYIKRNADRTIFYEITI